MKVFNRGWIKFVITQWRIKTMIFGIETKIFCLLWLVLILTILVSSRKGKEYDEKINEYEKKLEEEGA